MTIWPSWRTCPHSPRGCSAGSLYTFTGALLAGARPEDLAAALGDSLDEMFRRWHDWASGQRNLVIADKPGMTAEEYETVADLFAAAGSRRRRS